LQLGPRLRTATNRNEIAPTPLPVHAVRITRGRVPTAVTVSFPTLAPAFADGTAFGSSRNGNWVGNFSNNHPTPGEAGLAWDTNFLSVDGLVRVVRRRSSLTRPQLLPAPQSDSAGHKTCSSTALNNNRCPTLASITPVWTSTNCFVAAWSQQLGRQSSPSV